MPVSLIAFSLAFSATPVTTFDVAFDQKDGPWAIQVKAAGQANVVGEEVHLALKDFVVATDPGSKKTESMKGYSVCLAFRRSEDAWDTAGCSSYVQTSLSLAPGESRSIDAAEISIPAKGLPPLENFWLVMRVETGKYRGRQTFVYAHSQKSVFSKR